MDLTSRGITWVGNIYDKFETICQDLDKNVTQETVKYVGNQMQHVGESMKKFYSDVVEDFLPPIVDPVKCEAQPATLKTNSAIDSYIKSVVGVIHKDSECDIERPTTLDPVAVDSVNNEASYDVHLQLNPTPENQPQVGKHEAEAGKLKHMSVNEKSNVTVPENAISDHLECQPITSSSEQPPKVLDDILMGGKSDVSVREKTITDHLEHYLITSTSLNPPREVDNILVKEKPDMGFQENGTNDNPEHQSTFSISVKPIKETDNILVEEKSDSDQENAITDHPQHQPIAITSVSPPQYSRNSDVGLQENGISDHLEQHSIYLTSVNTPEQQDNILVEAISDNGVQENAITGLLEDQHITSTPVNPPKKLKNIFMDEKSDVSVQESAISYHFEQKPITSTSTNPSIGLQPASHLGEDGNVLLNEQLNASTKENLLEGKLFASQVSELQNPAEKDPVDVSLHSDFVNGNYMGMSEAWGNVTLPPSINGVGASLPQSVTVSHDVLANDTECFSGVSSKVSYSQMSPSVVCGQQKTAEREFILPSCSPINNSDTSEKPLDDHLLKSGVDTLGDESESASDSLGAVSYSIADMAVSSESKLGEMAPNNCCSDLYLENSEKDTSEANRNWLPVESSQSQQGHFSEPTQFEDLISSLHMAFKEFSDEGCRVIDDQDMETIDLHDKVKLDESPAIMGIRDLYAVLKQSRRYGSYRLVKKIRDAFTSRRRLVKEYEQLALWFEDTDFWLGQDVSPSPSSLSPTISSDERDQGTQDACDDPEWELL